MCDVALNFRVAYYDHDVLVTNGCRIAWAYLKTWFLLDFLTCFPFEWTTRGWLPDLRPGKVMKVGKIVKAGKLLRLTKLSHRRVMGAHQLTDRISDWLEDKVMSSEYQAFARVSGLIVKMVVTCHWLACFMVFVGNNWAQSSGG